MSRIRLFDELPVLSDGAVLLRKLEDRDREALWEFAHTGRIYRYLPTFLMEQSDEDAGVVLDRMYGKCMDEKTSMILGVFPEKDDSFCGLAEFYGYKESIHKTCIGYRLAERFWGRGLASAAVALMVDYLFSKTDVEIITASTMVENHASARVLEKNGFIRTSHAVPEDWGYDAPTVADKWFR